MENQNLETLIKNLCNHACEGLSDDLVCALLETAKQLPVGDEHLLAIRLSSLVSRELLQRSIKSSPELLDLAHFIKREELKCKQKFPLSNATEK